MENSRNYKRYAVYLILAIVIVWTFSREKPGRYALSSGAGEMAYVLDTKTGHLWLRFLGGNTLDLGTNENPKREVVEMEKAAGE